MRSPAKELTPERHYRFKVMDVLLAWLIERLGPRAVNRTAIVMALVCGLAAVAFVVALVLALAR